MSPHDEANATKSNILVVDDTHANLHFLTKLLTMQNYTVRPVPEGQIAVASAKAAPPDLILLDIMMPNMSGYEVCEQLKADERTRDIPIIFISVKNEVLDKVKAFTLGGVDYITKPFDPEEVMSRVKTHLSLRNLQKTLEQKNQYLEQEVGERKIAEEKLSNAYNALQQTLEALKKTQNQLVESEKLADLGQMIAGIAHELNTPLGAIHSASDHLQQGLMSVFEGLPEFFKGLPPERQQDVFALLQHVSQETTLTSTREKRELRKMLQKTFEEYEIPEARRCAEIFVNLGIAQATALHFLPLLRAPEQSVVLGMIAKLGGLQKSVTMLGSAVEKALKVIHSLKLYARYDYLGECVQADLIKGIETVLTLYQNIIKQGIDVVRNYHYVPPMFCYPDELMQVWSNLIQNAIYAMENTGTLTISITTPDASPDQPQPMVCVSISDTGAGIPPDIQEKIFEPFFTTKPMGEGNGLGLDIVRKIVEKHHGQIHFTSQPGATTFTVLLPLRTEA